MTTVNTAPTILNPHVIGQTDAYDGENNTSTKAEKKGNARKDILRHDLLNNNLALMPFYASRAAKLMGDAKVLTDADETELQEIAKEFVFLTAHFKDDMKLIEKELREKLSEFLLYLKMFFNGETNENDLTNELQRIFGSKIPVDLVKRLISLKQKPEILAAITHYQGSLLNMLLRQVNGITGKDDDGQQSVLNIRNMLPKLFESEPLLPQEATITEASAKQLSGLVKLVKEFFDGKINEENFKGKARQLVDSIVATSKTDDASSPKFSINDILWMIEEMLNKERKFSMERANIAIGFISNCIVAHQSRIESKARTELHFAITQFVLSMVIGSIQMGLGLKQMKSAKTSNPSKPSRENNDSKKLDEKLKGLGKATSKAANGQGVDQVDGSAAATSPASPANSTAPKNSPPPAADTNSNLGSTKAIDLKSNAKPNGTEAYRIFSDALSTMNGAASSLINGLKAMALKDDEKAIVQIQGNQKIFESLLQSNLGLMNNSESDSRKAAEQAKSLLEAKNRLEATALSSRSA